MDDNKAIPYRIIPNTGGGIDPNDVIGRDHVCTSTFAQLLQGNNLSLPDPRRMGKSAFLARLQLVADNRHTVVVADFQGCTSTAEFLDKLINALAQHATFGTRFRKLTRTLLSSIEAEYGGVRVKAALGAVSPLLVLQQVIESVAAKLADDEMVVLACDEVPIAIKNIADHHGEADAVALLLALRSLRTPESRVRWLITGSIGFHHVVRLIGSTIGVVNDLGTLKLGPLDPSGARFLAECLLIGVGRDGDPAAADRMAQLSGGIAYLLHQIAHLMPRSTSSATPAEVEQAFGDFIRDRDQSHALTHFLTRLNGYYGDHEALAMRVLDHLAQTDSAATLAQLHEALKMKASQTDELREVVDWLEDDHYLFTTPTGLAWRYDVLRQIWIIRRRLTT